jgi:glyoxylate reductase
MERKKKVLISRRFVGNAAARIRDLYEVREWPHDEPMPKATLREWIADCDGYFGVGDPLDEEVLREAVRLKVISTVAAGTDNIDLQYCTQNGIAVGHTPGAVTAATADMTMALLLAALRGLIPLAEKVRSGRWLMNAPALDLGRDPAGKTLGIVGMGQIGLAVARRAEAFGMNVVYYSRKTMIPSYRRCDSLRELAEHSDVVSLHVPLTDETYHLIDRHALRWFKRDAWLINMSRGPVVDLTALTDALQNGQLAGAALDVTEPEPIPADHPVLRLPNVLVTPHAGSATRETREAMANLALENLLRGLNGQKLKHCANPQVYDR